MDQSATIVWSERPFEQYRQLSAKIQRLIGKKLILLQQHPEMYQMETSGHWEGLRRMPVHWYRLYYTYWHSNHTIYIDALVSYQP